MTCWQTIFDLNLSLFNRQCGNLVFISINLRSILINLIYAKNKVIHLNLWFTMLNEIEIHRIRVFLSLESSYFIHLIFYFSFNLNIHLRFILLFSTIFHNFSVFFFDQNNNLSYFNVQQEFLLKLLVHIYLYVSNAIRLFSLYNEYKCTQ